MPVLRTRAQAAGPRQRREHSLRFHYDAEGWKYGGGDVGKWRYYADGAGVRIAEKVGNRARGHIEVSRSSQRRALSGGDLRPMSQGRSWPYYDPRRRRVAHASRRIAVFRPGALNSEP